MASEGKLVDRLSKIECKICSDVSKKVCVLLPNVDEAIACIDDMEELGSRDGNWVEVVNDIKSKGLYDKFVEAYAEATGKPVDTIRFLFDNIERITKLRDSDKGGSNDK